MSPVLEIVLSRDAKRPLHLQLKTQLAHLIRSGLLEPGERLPTVRTVAGHLGLNRNTVQKAFNGLEQMGLLVCRIGDGTYVRRLQESNSAERFTPEAINQLRSVVLELHQRGVTASALRQVFDAVVREVVSTQELRASQLIESRRRFASRHAYR